MVEVKIDERPAAVPEVFWLNVGKLVKLAADPVVESFPESEATRSV